MLENKLSPNGFRTICHFISIVNFLKHVMNRSLQNIQNLKMNIGLSRAGIGPSVEHLSAAE